MGLRLQLQALLESILGSDAVYFQAPSSELMVYPCIVYNRDRTETEFAGNNPYRFTKRYQVTVIDEDPDSTIPDRVGALPMCTHDRTFVVDNLNHYVFTLYF
jgi:hypothetical protein